MKKKSIATMTATVLAAAVLGACSAVSESGQAGASSTAVETTAAAEATAVQEPEVQKERAAIFLNLGDSEQANAAWEGLRRYTDEMEYAGPPARRRGEKTEEKLEEMVKAEAAAGSAVVACYGADFEAAVLAVAPEYPETIFLLLDSREEELPENVYGLSFKEEQAGFLAGYAAVYNGSGNLGYIGSRDDPESIRYGYGFVQGADAAALEREREIRMKYAYVPEEEDPSQAGELAKEWYAAGTEVVFVAGELNSQSVIEAAQAKGGKVIGSGHDWSGQSPVVLTSAVKMISNSVYDLMKQIDARERSGGENLRLGAAEYGVGLAMETSRFQDFSETEYDLVCQGLAEGDYTPLSDLGKEGKKLELSDLNLTNTEIITVESDSNDSDRSGH